MAQEKRFKIGTIAFFMGVLIGTVAGIINSFTGWFVWSLIAIGCIIGVLTWIYNDPKVVLPSSFALVLLGQFGPNALVQANIMLTILYGLTIVFIPVAISSAMRLMWT